MNPARFASCLVLLLSIGTAPAADSRVPQASLVIQGDAVQPAGVPVLLELVIRNTGSVPIQYWCGGPGEYPNATDFTATLTGTGLRHLDPFPLSNAQATSGPGGAIELAPGQSVRMPAVLGVESPGEFDVTVTGAASGRVEDGTLRLVTWPVMRSIAPFHFTVRDDPDLLAKRDRRVLAGVRAADPFIRYVSSTWPRSAVRNDLVKDLKGDDALTADRAADGLWGDREPAAEDGPLVAQVILKHLQPPKEGSDLGILTKLMQRSGDKPFESHDVRVAVAKLAVARGDSAVGDRASAALGLEGKDGYNPLVHNTIGRIRGSREEPPRLKALLALLKTEDVNQRRLAYQQLAQFPGHPSALRAARDGLLDKDPLCRREAALSLTLISNVAETRPTQ